MDSVTADDLIQLYHLQPHPEGGFYRETYRSDGMIPKGAFGDRHYSTAIYFLLTSNSKSCLHRLKADEVWHFYLGDPLILKEIFSDGRVEKTILSHNVKAGHKLQHIVQAECWFGGYTSGSYSFVGCTSAPGFDFADFELGDKSRLISQFPNAKDVIEALSPILQ